MSDKPHNSNVVPFHSRREIDAQQMLELLDDMRERIVEGNIAAIGFCYVTEDISVGTVSAPTDLGGPLIGAAQLLLHRLLVSLESSEED